MGRVLRFPARDEVAVDETTLRFLQRTLGRDRFTEICDDASATLIDHLDGIDKALRAADSAVVERLAHGVSEMAGMIGLDVLAFVATNLQACARSGDRNAMRAVGERLIRMGEASLFSVLDLTHQGAS